MSWAAPGAGARVGGFGFNAGRVAAGQQLVQRGLRAAAEGTGADLKVQAWLIVDERQEQISTHYGGAWGGWNDYWAAPGYTETRRVDYQVATLQLDLQPDRSLEKVSQLLAKPRGSRSMAKHLQSQLGIEGVKAGLLRELTGADTFNDPARLAAAIMSASVASGRP